MAHTVHTHYDNLSVARDAPIEVIEASFNALIARYDPEKWSDRAEAERIIAVLHVSHNVLVISATRAAHDAWIASTEGQLSSDTTARPAQTGDGSPTGGGLSGNGFKLDRVPAPQSSVAKPLVQKANYVELMWVVVGIIALCAILWAVSRPATHSSASLSRSDVPTSPSQAVPEPKTHSPSAAPSEQTTQAPRVFAPTIAVAALNANLRAEPVPRSRIIKVLSRGTSAEQVGVEGTFLKVQLADGTIGWLAEEVVVSWQSAERLNRTSSTMYRVLPDSVQRSNAVDSEVKSVLSQRFTDIANAVIARDVRASQLIKSLAETKVAASVMADVDASKWFTLGANADRASGDLAGALKQYQAAAAAAPNLGGNQSAVALVAYELNEADILSKSASAALALAPETTNPWFTFGLSVAQMGDTINHQKMASGAFLLSLHYSRDTMFTRKYLLKSSEQARDTRVSRAILDALREHALNPRIFGEPNAPRVSQ